MSGTVSKTIYAGIQAKNKNQQAARDIANGRNYSVYSLQKNGKGSSPLGQHYTGLTKAQAAERLAYVRGLNPTRAATYFTAQTGQEPRRIKAIAALATARETGSLAAARRIVSTTSHPAHTSEAGQKNIAKALAAAEKSALKAAPGTAPTVAAPAAATATRGLLGVAKKAAGRFLPAVGLLFAARDLARLMGAGQDTARGGPTSDRPAQIASVGGVVDVKEHARIDPKTGKITTVKAHTRNVG